MLSSSYVRFRHARDANQRTMLRGKVNRPQIFAHFGHVWSSNRGSCSPFALCKLWCLLPLNSRGDIAVRWIVPAFCDGDSMKIWLCNSFWFDFCTLLITSTTEGEGGDVFTPFLSLFVCRISLKSCGRIRMKLGGQVGCDYNKSIRFWWRSESGSGHENYLVLNVILHHWEIRPKRYSTV